MKASEVFVKEINLIKNDMLKEIVSNALDLSPDCILTIPASSSMKYHPLADIVIGKRNEDGEVVETGGLVNHIITVTAIAKTLMDNDTFKHMALGVGIIDDETLEIYQDAALASCLLHDCMKPDDTPEHHTTFTHPLRAANLFKECVKEYIATHELSKEETMYLKAVTPIIHSSISSHMGKWNTSKYSDKVLPTPKLGIEQFVHLCDYIASRKFIDFNFDKYYGA